MATPTTDEFLCLSDIQQTAVSIREKQTCQGPEMKMRETVRHSGEGAIFFRGEALPVMRPLSKFSDSCLHSCCKTEEIKFTSALNQLLERSGAMLVTGHRLK